MKTKLADNQKYITVDSRQMIATVIVARDLKGDFFTAAILTQPKIDFTVDALTIPAAEAQQAVATTANDRDLVPVRPCRNEIFAVGATASTPGATATASTVSATTGGSNSGNSRPSRPDNGGSSNANSGCGCSSGAGARGSRVSSPSP